MKHSFYVLSSGTLKRKDDTIQLVMEEKNKYIPVEIVESLHVFGEVDLNKRLLQFLNRKGICIHFYNYYSQYIGSFVPESFSSGKIFLAQYKSYQEHRMKFAKKILLEEVEAILINLRYYNRKPDMCFDDLITRVVKYKNDINKINEINSLRSLEGRIRVQYYSIFDQLIKPEEFRFVKREYYPPKNEVNALLSFGNAIVYSEIKSLIIRHGLNPSVSYLHATNSRNDSLVYDLSEKYKPVIVDRSIFNLLNRRQLRKKHFIYEDEKVFLNEEGKTIFLDEIMKRMKEKDLFHAKSITLKSEMVRSIISFRNLVQSCL